MTHCFSVIESQLSGSPNKKQFGWWQCFSSSRGPPRRPQDGETLKYLRQFQRQDQVSKLAEDEQSLETLLIGFCISLWPAITYWSKPHKTGMRVLSDLSCNTSNSRRSTGRLGWLGYGVVYCSPLISMSCGCGWKSIIFLMLLILLHHLWRVWLHEKKKIREIKFRLPQTSLKFNVIGRVPTRASYKNHPSLTLMYLPLTNSPHTVLWTRLFAKVISIWLIREAKWVHNHFYISCLLKIRRICTTICLKIIRLKYTV